MDKPLLKWLGGKSWMGARLPKIIGPVTGDYVEPFCGGLGAYLQMVKAKAFNPETRIRLYDKNSILMQSYFEIVFNAPDVWEAFKALPGNGESWRPKYNKIRSRFNEEVTKEQGKRDMTLVASHLLWLNKSCYSGMYRVNNRGEFNVPCADYKTRALATEEELEAFSDMFSWHHGQELQLGDYTMAFAQARNGTTFYCDPPYLDVSKRIFNAYTPDAFDLSDHFNLARLAEAAARNHGCKVVVSNADSEFARAELYPPHRGWEIKGTFNRKRTFGAKNLKGSELFVSIGEAK